MGEPAAVPEACAMGATRGKPSRAAAAAAAAAGHLLRRDGAACNVAGVRTGLGV